MSVFSEKADYLLIGIKFNIMSCKSVLMKNDFPNKTGKTTSYLEDKSHNVGIYCWTNKASNNKKYIGQAEDLKKRKKAFIKFNRKKYSGQLINRARQKYNSTDYWDYEILEYCRKEKLNEREQYYIAFYKTNDKSFGYNLTDGGDGVRGYKVSEEMKRHFSVMYKGKPLSEETKQKISEAVRGEKNGFYGKHHSDETKNKLSFINRGKKVSEEVKKKISEGNKGRIHSEKSIQKMREAQKGKIITEETKKKISDTLKGKYVGELNPNFGKHLSKEHKLKLSKSVIQIDSRTNNIIKEWDSLADASNELGINRAHICNCCKGERRVAGGYKWRYKENPVAEYIPKSKAIPILQINLETNEIIKEWKSATEASKELNFTRSSITNCCRGKEKSAYGFKWKYKSDIN